MPGFTYSAHVQCGLKACKGNHSFSLASGDGGVLAMRAFVFAISAVTCAAQIGGLTNWESHGELMDKEKLSQPVLDDDFITNHNARNDVTWTAGRNIIFEGATMQDVKIRLGTLQSHEPEHRLPFKAPEKLVDLPDEFDWRTDSRAANCPSLKEVRDQAACGSCWAFGSVEAMTDRRCIASGGKDQTHLSAEDVTSCDHLGDMGCNGGIPSTVYTYYRMSGVVDGGNYGDKSMCYSYQLKPCAHHTTSSKYPACAGSTATPKCESKCIDNGAAWGKSKHHGQAGCSVCSQNSTNGACAEQMRQEIYQNGPITGMFFVHKSFESYKSGVYKAGDPITDPMLGGHAIKILGWGTEQCSLLAGRLMNNWRTSDSRPKATVPTR